MSSVADHLSQVPVIIGHSLGGFVVQKYLEFHVAPAGVLVASTPPQGAAAAVLRTAQVLLRKTAEHPWLTAKAIMTGESLPGFNKLERVRTMFFSAHTPESWVARYAERLQTEQSGRAALDMVFLNLPKPHRVSTPLLVLGAQCDRSVTPQEVHATARAYHTQAEIFPNMGHDMMLEPGWVGVPNESTPGSALKANSFRRPDIQRIPCEDSIARPQQSPPSPPEPCTTVRFSYGYASAVRSLSTQLCPGAGVELVHVAVGADEVDMQAVNQHGQGPVR